MTGLLRVIALNSGTEKQLLTGACPWLTHRIQAKRVALQQCPYLVTLLFSPAAPGPHSLGWAAGFTSAGAHSCTQGSPGPCMLAWRQGVPQSRYAGVQSAGYLSIQREKSKSDEAIPGLWMKPWSFTQLLPSWAPHLPACS